MAEEATRSNQGSTTDLVAAQNRLIDLKAQYDREVAAHSETGAQLITLVNKTNSLSNENADLKVLTGTQGKQLEKLTKERHNIDSSLAEKSKGYEVCKL